MQMFEDFWASQLFCRIIQSTKQSKPHNHDLGCHKIHSVCYLKPRIVKAKIKIMNNNTPTNSMVAF